MGACRAAIHNPSQQAACGNFLSVGNIPPPLTKTPNQTGTYSLGMTVAPRQVEREMTGANKVEVEFNLREQSKGETLSTLIRLNKVDHMSSLHPRGRVLFAEETSPRGVYILRAGKVSLSASSSEGRVAMLRIAQPGDVLGLNSVLRNVPYDATARTLSASRTEFVSRSKLLELIEHDQSAALAVTMLLSEELTELIERAKSLSFAGTVSGRLARLLLEQARTNSADPHYALTFERVLTHEEIAQMISSSRETVTRLLATLSRREVIHITPQSILIKDPLALEKLASA